MTASEVKDWFIQNPELISKIIIGTILGLIAYLKGLPSKLWSLFLNTVSVIKFNCHLVKESRTLKKSISEVIKLTCLPSDVTRTLQGNPQPFKRSLYSWEYGVYFLSDFTHNNDIGPFCPACADNKSAAIHLLPSGDRWHCHTCNHMPRQPIGINQYLESKKLHKTKTIP